MRRRSGFTLIEMMIVLAIIAALAAILTPIGMNAINTAKASQVLSDVRNLKVGSEMYYIQEGSIPGGLSDLLDSVHVNKQDFARNPDDTYTLQATPSSAAATGVEIKANYTPNLAEVVPENWNSAVNEDASATFNFKIN